MIQRIDRADGKLPYPTRPLQVQGGTVEEYIIPEENKAEVLAQLYIFDPVPGHVRRSFAQAGEDGSGPFCGLVGLPRMVRIGIRTYLPARPPSREGAGGRKAPEPIRVRPLHHSGPTAMPMSLATV